MKKRTKHILVGIGIMIVGINGLALLHAYKFTHFDADTKSKTTAENLSTLQKMKALLLGVSLPRPESKIQPDSEFEAIEIKSNVRLAAWYLPTEKAKGTVALFHGYGAEKSTMLGRAYALKNMGYNILLVDFMGAGNSEGNTCTIGYKEAENVASVVDYLTSKAHKQIYLFGTSLGAAAIMRYTSQQPNQLVKGIIIECPFGSMMQTVKNRFEILKTPAFPMANLLVFWGGMVNGFNSFEHNPEDYAKAINQPTLLLYGAKDDRVKLIETNRIFKNLNCKKELVIFPTAGHESYLEVDAAMWTEKVSQFLHSTQP